MVTKKSLIVFFIFLLLSKAILSKENGNAYYINIYNELPSNHIYSALTDSLGYIWFCSPKGVIRYNGYDLKVYNVADGLTNDDVWGFYLDQKHRLWLRSISNKISYIQNNKLVAVSNAENKVLYPRHITDYDEGVMFFTNEEGIAPANSLVLCYEKNNRIYFTSYRFADGDVAEKSHLHTYNRDTTKVYRFHIKDGLSLLSQCIDSSKKEVTIFTDHEIFKDHVVSYKKGSNVYRLNNLKNCSNQYHFLTSNDMADNILFVDHNNGFLYILAERNIYKIDSTITIIAKYALAKLLPDYSKTILTNFYEDDFWGKCITTKNAGVFFINGNEGEYHKLNLPISDIDFVPTHSKTEIRLLHKKERRLLTLDTNGKIKFSANLPYDLQKLVSVGSGSLLAIVFDRLYSFDDKTRSLEEVNFLGYSHGPIKDVVIDGEGRYVIATSIEGVYRIALVRDTVLVKKISNNRFEHLIYDSLRNTIWAYNDNSVELHAKDTSFFFNEISFSSFGIKNIEQVLVDQKYGNVFIKDYDHLYCLNTHSGTIKNMLPNYYLKETKCILQDDQLVLAGSYGVVASKVVGVGKISTPIVYRNFRKALYHYVEDIAIMNNDVLLNTDKGIYRLSFNTNAATSYSARHSKPSYKLIVNIAEKLYDLSELTEIELNQKTRQFSLDVINPKGEGKPSFKYKIPGVVDKWQQLNGSELFLPDLKPGKKYSICFVAQDDFWISDPITKELFIIPYWWQTPQWVLCFWVLSFVAFILFVLLVVFTTRFFVIKNNEKKRFLTELELRSVYSQLNPHFVFNSLNLALFYIKKKQQNEAHESILKFSNLLRGYLNSSRNRYISLAEEIKNLKNYIELQQARFNDKFTYTLTTQNIESPEEIFIPSLLLQPIVENAINHGLLPRRNKGELNISFIKDAKKPELCFIVDDNGIGREKSKQIQNETGSDRKSFGNNLIEELIKLLNKYDKLGVEIAYFDKEHPLQGTTVVIKIKKPRYEKLNQKHYC